MKTERNRVSLEQATNHPPSVDRPASELTKDAQKAVDGDESRLTTMFIGGEAAQEESEEVVSGPSADAATSDVKDDAWFRGEINRQRLEIDRCRLEIKRLVIQNSVLTVELGKYPMLNDPALLATANQLTPNDQDILVAMYEMAATTAKPEVGKDIFDAALGKGDHKKGFDRLIAEGLVDSREGRGGGYWLTPKGSHVAIALTILNMQKP